MRRFNTGELTPVQKVWVQYLRSGEFAQTTGTLRNDEGYCCLGVGCVAISDTLKTPLEVDEFTMVGSLSEKRRRQLGVFGPEARVNVDKGYSYHAILSFLEKEGLTEGQLQEAGVRLSESTLHLTILNDVWNLTFEQIADFIEEFRDLIFQ